MRLAGTRRSTSAVGHSWMSPASVLWDKLWKAVGGCIAGNVSLCCASQTSLLLSLEKTTCPGSRPAPSRSLKAAADHTDQKKKYLKRDHEAGEVYCLVLTVLIEGDGSAVDHKIRQLHSNLLPSLHLLLLLHLLSWR